MKCCGAWAPLISRLAGKRRRLLPTPRQLRSTPILWSNYNSLGSAYFTVGENDRALAAYQHITELEPGRAEGWEGVGSVYFRLGRWSESLSKFQKAIDLQPRATFYSNLGTAYYFLGLFDKAADHFGKSRFHDCRRRRHSPESG